eukprot:CAMPEP_0170465846 /NCGR_PEP_ID=MMETSP0123-20130129/10032_1 /TAXON_ID=182087 /ORGANISM="Favella ehrenbergii, Strain Fehren 1" /LENGTH=203 /DNA_ID=CAMNT_0010731835 /DNA_START=133 /DNA_END=743 /DNA_ORIENTATION=-
MFKLVKFGGSTILKLGLGVHLRHTDCPEAHTRQGFFLAGELFFKSVREGVDVVRELNIACSDSNADAGALSKSSVDFAFSWNHDLHIAQGLKQGSLLIRLSQHELDLGGAAIDLSEGGLRAEYQIFICVARTCIEATTHGGSVSGLPSVSALNREGLVVHRCDLLAILIELVAHVGSGEGGRVTQEKRRSVALPGVGGGLSRE